MERHGEEGKVAKGKEEKRKKGKTNSTDNSFNPPTHLSNLVNQI
jgi:hypothetical protein